MNRSVLLLAAAAALLSACNDDTLATLPPGTDAPVAVIDGGQPQYAPLATANFDGSASHDPDGGAIAHFDWQITQRPTGSNSSITPLSPDGSQVAFFVDFAGDYTVKLTVTDDEGMTGSTNYAFSSVPWQAIHVELAWDTDLSDVDLHLVNDTDGGTFYSNPGDCYYADKNPNWGSYSSPTDDPSLDIDDVDGFGPENINISTPQDAHVYHVLVHFYDTHGAPATKVTIKIFLSGVEQYEAVQTLGGTGVAWDVATIAWPSGTITPVNTLFNHAPG